MEQEQLDDSYESVEIDHPLPDDCHSTKSTDSTQSSKSKNASQNPLTDAQKSSSIGEIVNQIKNKIHIYKNKNYL